MSSIEKAKRRDKKRRKERYGHKVDSKSVFLIQRLQIERAEKAKQKKEKNGFKKQGI